MALVQYIAYGQGGVLKHEPTSRPSNALISVYDGDGAVIVNNQTMTVHAASTVLTAAAAKRASNITVDNATPITEGLRIRLSSPTEWARVKTVSGNVVFLWSGLREAHSNNATVESTLCTYSVGAGNADTTFFDGRGRIELSSNQIAYIGVECTLYPLERTATELDLRQVNPQITALLAAEEDPEEAMDAAHEYVLEQLGKRGRARTNPASSEFNRCVSLAFMRNHYLGQSSEVARQSFEKFDRELGQAIATVMANVTPDEDQDGVVEADEQKSANTFLMERG